MGPWAVCPTTPGEWRLSPATERHKGDIPGAKEVPLGNRTVRAVRPGDRHPGWAVSSIGSDPGFLLAAIMPVQHLIGQPAIMRDRDGVGGAADDPTPNSRYTKEKTA